MHFFRFYLLFGHYPFLSDLSDDQDHFLYKQIPMYLVIVHCGSSWLFHCSWICFSGSRENCLLLRRFLIMRTWASCSDRLFVMGDREVIFSLLSSTDVLSMAVVELFWSQTLLCASDYILLIRRLFFSVAFNDINCVYASTNSDLVLYRSFKVSSTFL